MFHQVGTDQLVVITVSQLQELINNSVKAAVDAAFNKHSYSNNQPPKEKEVKYLTRKEVKELLHTSLPTVDKYSQPGSILNPIYFGKKKLYREDELNEALPKINALLGKKKAA